MANNQYKTKERPTDLGRIVGYSAAGAFGLFVASVLNPKKTFDLAVKKLYELDPITKVSDSANYLQGYSPDVLTEKLLYGAILVAGYLGSEHKKLSYVAAGTGLAATLAFDGLVKGKNLEEMVYSTLAAGATYAAGRGIGALSNLLSYSYRH